MKSIIVLAHNIQSTHNIGSIFRTCEGFGVKELWLSGYTPYPDLALSHLSTSPDSRLPHIRNKLTQQIHKTALNAEKLVPFRYDEQLQIEAAKQQGYQIIALEQSPNATGLNDFHCQQPTALIIGEERFGIPAETLQQCDAVIEIPMFGQKESFNVSVAAGIALYQLQVR